MKSQLTKCAGGTAPEILRHQQRAQHRPGAGPGRAEHERHGEMERDAARQVRAGQRPPS